jgi:hypothetical protein
MPVGRCCHDARSAKFLFHLNTLSARAACLSKRRFLSVSLMAMSSNIVVRRVPPRPRLRVL